MQEAVAVWILFALFIGWSLTDGGVGDFLLSFIVALSWPVVVPLAVVAKLTGSLKRCGVCRKRPYYEFREAHGVTVCNHCYRRLHR